MLALTKVNLIFRYLSGGNQKGWAKLKLLVCFGCLWLLAWALPESVSQVYEDELDEVNLSDSDVQLESLRLVVTNQTTKDEYKSMLKNIVEHKYAHIEIDNQLARPVNATSEPYLHNVIAAAISSTDCHLLSLTGLSLGLKSRTKLIAHYKDLIDRFIKSHPESLDLPGISIDIQDCDFMFITTLHKLVATKRTLHKLNVKGCAEIPNLAWVQSLPWSFTQECVFSITNCHLADNIQTNLYHLGQATAMFNNLSISVSNIVCDAIVEGFVSITTKINLSRVTLSLSLGRIYDLVVLNSRIVNLEKLTITEPKPDDCEPWLDQLSAQHSKWVRKSWHIVQPVEVQMSKYYYQQASKESTLSEFLTKIGIVGKAEQVIFTYQDWSNLMIFKLFRIPYTNSNLDSEQQNSGHCRIDLTKMVSHESIQLILSQYIAHYRAIPQSSYETVEIVGGQIISSANKTDIEHWTATLRELLTICALIKVRRVVVSGNDEYKLTASTLAKSSSAESLLTTPTPTTPSSSSRLSNASERSKRGSITSGSANSRNTNTLYSEAEDITFRPPTRSETPEFGTLELLNVTLPTILLVVEDLPSTGYFKTIEVFGPIELDSFASKICDLLSTYPKPDIALIRFYGLNGMPFEIKPLSSQSNPTTNPIRQS
ncbi:hypothetical protein NEHOM01_0583 [Nematocida homosporus]|uniref:uncharacterized protein n=1 Tax=Nematocida homosporus TaxID=1912981 RepID=UPI00221FF084|nr:uncharacterized protein NEHOM01_0583 [Nematocida homosporus]KAI5185078.1 hypothetical protein NEHOM01_0583 [Nematocida homosporus]